LAFGQVGEKIIKAKTESAVKHHNPFDENHHNDKKI
jgi:hypothetical protein